jgi:uncharacterized membrane protein
LTTSPKPLPTNAEPKSNEVTSESNRIHDHERDFYAAFKRDWPLAWLLTLVGPPLITVALLVVMYLLLGAQFVRKLSLTAVATFFVFGKFVILGGEDPAIGDVAQFLTHGQLFLLVFYMDLMTAILLVFHAGFMFRIPIIGPKLLALAADGQVMLRFHPWMRRATFIGVIAFVMFPLAATGSVGGAIFGRLLGMTRMATLTGICIGSVLGCGLMYFGAELVHEYLDRDNPAHIVGGIAVIALVIFLLNVRYRHMKKRMLDEMQGEADSQ